MKKSDTSSEHRWPSDQYEPPGPCTRFFPKPHRPGFCSWCDCSVYDHGEFWVSGAYSGPCSPRFQGVYPGSGKELREQYMAEVEAARGES